MSEHTCKHAPGTDHLPVCLPPFPQQVRFRCLLEAPPVSYESDPEVRAVLSCMAHSSAKGMGGGRAGALTDDQVRVCVAACVRVYRHDDARVAWPCACACVRAPSSSSSSSPRPLHPQAQRLANVLASRAGVLGSPAPARQAKPPSPIMRPAPRLVEPLGHAPNPLRQGGAPHLQLGFPIMTVRGRRRSDGWALGMRVAVAVVVVRALCC